MNSELEKIAYVYGDVCIRKKKQRRKRQKRLIIELLFDYAKNSTLHGLRYIAERGLSLIEKLFWFTTFVASIALCTYFSYNVYLKWKSSPVIVTVNGRLASVGTVPFPSVTVCPAIKCKQSVYNYSDALDKILNLETYEREKQLEKFENIERLCDFTTEIDMGTNDFSPNLTKNIAEVSLTYDDIFMECLWNGAQTDCKELFSRVYTEEGICYSMNNLAARDIFTDEIQSDYLYMESNQSIVGWSPHTGEYADFSNKNAYPRRGRVYGSDPDFEIFLMINAKDKDTSCNAINSGYQIYLHHPSEYPISSLYYYAALPSQVSNVAIGFNQLNTDTSLLNSFPEYPADVRQCYFQFERPLRYFKLYTAKNCRTECLSNYTYAKCKCVEFYMPHDNSSEICSLTWKSCVDEAKDLMAELELNAELGIGVKNACMCRPACDNIEYEAEILKSDFHMAKAYDKYFKRWGFTNFTEPGIEYSKINLFFKKPQFVTMQRRELFGITDFLANVGGLLGLFLGFSFLSLVEILYFLTLRVGCTLKRDLIEEKGKKIQQDEVKVRH